MRVAARATVLMLAGLLLGAGSGSPGVTLYISRVVAAAPGSVALDALVYSSVSPSPAAQEQLSRSITVLADTVQYLPVASYANQLEAAFGSDAIIVGSWSLLVPRGTSAEGQGYLLDRLADYLVGQGLLGDQRAELTFTMGSSSGTVPRDGTPAFRVVRTSRATEVSFQLTGSTGGSVAGRVTLPPAAQAAVDSAETTARLNSTVKVVFRKGPITVEMPGRVVGGGAVGQPATVYIPDSQKTFTGRVLDGKAVQVDLP